MSVKKHLLQAAAGNGESIGAWDISYAYFDPPSDYVGNLSTAVYANENFYVNAQDTDPRSVFFKPDGTKMYVGGSWGIDINEYTLSTPWAVWSASFVQNFSVSARVGNVRGISFKEDGTKMYVVDDAANDITEYALSTAWDISTSTYSGFFSVSTQGSPTGLFIKPDGTKMYVTTDGDEINEYSLSTAWQVNTASYTQFFSTNSQETAVTAVSFLGDGTKMYVIGTTGDDVNEYSLSTAWDVSTASYVQNFSVSLQEGNPYGLYVKSDGSQFFIIGINNDRVYGYRMGGFLVGSEETQPNAMAMSADGTNMYILGQLGDDVNQYTLSTAWDISTASFTQTFSISGQETTPESLFFKPDGTKMYLSGQAGDDINEYSLSTAWDVSTASYVQNFSHATEDVMFTGIFFKDDGTKMYGVGQAGDDVNEYSLSTAWDISTASYTQNFSISSQITSPQDLYFKPDGTTMYVVGSGKVSEYALSTEWDISTASFTQSLDDDFIGSGRGIAFKDDGTKIFFVYGGTVRSVFQYTLGVQ